MAKEIKNSRRMAVTPDETTIRREMIVDTTQQNAINILGWEIGDDYPSDADYKLVRMETQALGTQTKVTAVYSDHAEPIHDEDMDPVWAWTIEAVEHTSHKDRDNKFLGSKTDPVELNTVSPRAIGTVRVYRNVEAGGPFAGSGIAVYYDLIGKVNNAVFYTMPIGTCLYLGADVRWIRVSTELDTEDKIEIVHRFSYMDVKWNQEPYFHYKPEKVTLPSGEEHDGVKDPVAGDTLYADMYNEGDFSLLAIGTG